MIRRSVFSSFLAILVLAAPAVAHGSAPVGSAPSTPIPSPGAFYVRGSNGYTISVYADSTDKGDPRVLVSAVGRLGRVSVSAPADLGGEGIRADLGEYGRIDVSWNPSGQAEEGKSRCRGFSSTSIWFAGGEYVGTFSFNGEEEFTSAAADHVNGRQGWWRYQGCGYTVSEGYPGPGILLEAERSMKGAGGAYRYFSVVQNRSGGEVTYQAGVAEPLGPVKVYRAAYALAHAGTLRVDKGLGRAEVRPPAPFGGRGVFDRVKRGRPGTWRGNLTVDFPGRPDVVLVGGRWTASLMHGSREIEALRPASTR